MDIRLLGQLEILDGQREIPLAQGRRRALLTLLLLHRNEVVPAERLIDELWAGRPPPTAAKGLQVQISQLRKDLTAAGPPNGTALRTRGGGYVLEVAPGDLDVERFERALADAEAAMDEGRPDRAAARLREGLRLWRGPPLADVAYESFAQAEIARLEELHLIALERRADADLALGRDRELVAELEGLVREHPLRERLRGQLMLALYRCGRRAEALEAYRAGRRHSVDELGLEPGPELRRLEGQILADSPELAAPARPPPLAERAARRAPLVIVAAGVVLAGAAVLTALAIDSGRRPAARAASLDIAPNSAVALSADGRRAAFAVPLPGRPTDVAARGDQLFAVTVDSSSLTVVDARTHTIIRTVPLPRRAPAAVAAGPDGVWVAEGRRGLLARLDAGYEHVAAQAAWRRTGRAAAPGLSRHESTGVAVAAGAAWVTDGSASLRRADAKGRLTTIAAPHRLDGVTAAGDAVWALSTSGAAVVRVDARRRRITDVIPIVARPGSEAPAPVAIAATGDWVWVLNGNTATVSRIDARQRGVVGSTALGVEHGPSDIDVVGQDAWVANFDGSVTRIPAGGGPVRSTSLGGALTGVTGTRQRLWVVSTALDQQLPGGSG